jgi:hypothetical protein
LVEYDNAVEMVRHDYKFVKDDFGTDLGRPEPFFLNDLAERIQENLIGSDFSE